MKLVERKFIYTAKNYKRTGYGRTYNFVDVYLNGRLQNSVVVPRELTDSELERFLTVAIERNNVGDKAMFLDSTESEMNRFFIANGNAMSNIESDICAAIGEAKFNALFSRKYFRVYYTPSGFTREVPETFHVSSLPLLTCLKMAYLFGKTTGSKFRIVVDDESGEEIAPDILAFAISEA